MRVLLAAPHWIWSTGRHVNLALSRLGHDVRTVGPCLREYDGRALDSRYTWEPDYDPCPWKTGDQAHYLQSTPIEEVLDYFAAKDWKPDLILSVLGTYALRGKSNIPHVLWCVENDEHVNYYDIDGAVDFDYKFINDMNSTHMSDANTYYLPSGYDPDVHQNIVPWEYRPIQLMLVGNPYPERNYYMQILGRACRSFYSWGLNWDQFRTAYNAAQVSICLPSTTGVTPQRVFETTAMGCVLLSRTQPDFERLGLVKDVNYLELGTVEETYEVMKRVVFEPDSLDELRANAAEWVKPQTWDNRVQTIIETIGVESHEPERA